jgi:hypothetical protein
MSTSPITARRLRALVVGALACGAISAVTAPAQAQELQSHWVSRTVTLTAAGGGTTVIDCLRSQDPICVLGIGFRGEIEQARARGAVASRVQSDVDGFTTDYRMDIPADEVTPFRLVRNAVLDTGERLHRDDTQTLLELEVGIKRADATERAAWYGDTGGFAASTRTAKGHPRKASHRRAAPRR